jgi:hypothetical protein
MNNTMAVCAEDFALCDFLQNLLHAVGPGVRLTQPEGLFGGVQVMELQRGRMTIEATAGTPMV